MDRQRCLHIGGETSPDHAEVTRLGRREAASDDVRLTYVALTRAQSQVVAWWAPSWDEPNGGLSRLLRGRTPGDPVVPDRCAPAILDDADAMAALRAWADQGGPVLEDSVVVPAVEVDLPAPPSDLAVRRFRRHIDGSWRRTSYSGLIRAAETVGGVSSEPEVLEKDDEAADVPMPERADPDVLTVPSPMADLPMGAKFGTLVHAVLETADPFAAELATELEAQIREHSVWWPVDVSAEELAAALVPMHDTPLGPLAPGVTLRQIGLRDRLREMDFEFPLAGGDLRDDAPRISLADVGRLFARTHTQRRSPGDLRRAAVERRAGRAAVERLSDRLDRRGAASR